MTLLRKIAVVIAALGLIVVSAGTAAAVEVGEWRAYGNTNPITSSSSTWRCTPTIQIEDELDLKAQVCAVRSANQSGVQGALVVRNNESYLITVNAEVELVSLSGSLGKWVCPYSGVGANSWSVCFGRTLNHPGDVAAKGYAGGWYLGLSPYV